MSRLEKRRFWAACRRLLARGLPVAAATVVVGVWWAFTAGFGVDPFFLPSPADVAAALLRLPAHLVGQAWATMLVTLSGFAIAAAVGLTVAIGLVSSRQVEAAVLPLLVAANSVPKVAIVPLLVVWLGFGITPKIVMVVTICVFPIVICTAAGLNGTPAELVELTRSLQAGRWRTFVKVRLPWALPQVFVGLKVGISLAVIGTVVAEIANPDRGLGAVIVHASTAADTPLAFAAIMLLAVISVGAYYVLVAAERLLLPWAEENSS